MNKAYRTFWICKGTFGKTWGLKTQGGALNLHHGDQTHIDLQLHGLVAEGQIQCQQDRAQYVTEISLFGYNRGDEDDPNSCNGGPLGSPHLHVMMEVENQAGIYRLQCTQQWRPKSTNYCHTKKSQDMEHEPILWMRSDKTLLRYAYHKPFTAKLPDKCEQQNEFNSDRKGGLVWYTERPKTNKEIDAGVYRWCSRKVHSFSLEQHTMVFQAEIYAIKAQVMENVEKG